MGRKPTDTAEALQWWRDAVNGDPAPVYELEPECGYYKTRLWKRGPFYPARVWIDRPIVCFETGDLLSDEIWKCEINGFHADPWREWLWIAKHPITEANWKWLKAVSPLYPKPKAEIKPRIYLHGYGLQPT